MSTETARLVSQSRVLALDETTRRVKHVISTAALDLSNRMVEPEGWKLTRFRANPLVLADHEYAIERIIGRAHDVQVENGALVSTTEFDTEGLGNVAFRLVQAGLARSWSVGWIGLKQHYIGEAEGCANCAAAMKKRPKLDVGTHFIQQELLEYSLVAIPSNPDAVMGLHSAGLVGRDEAEMWIGAAMTSDPEPDADPEPDTDPEIEAVSRSAAFYDCVHTATRSFARLAAARRSASQIIRRIS